MIIGAPKAIKTKCSWSTRKCQVSKGGRPNRWEALKIASERLARGKEV